MKRFALVPVACAAALLFGACSGGATQSAPPNAASAPANVPVETASAEPPSRCAPAEMATTLEYQDGGAGHRYYVLRVENTGRVPCFIPAQLEVTPISSANGNMFTEPAPTRSATGADVTLEPGERIAMEVDAINPGALCPERTVSDLDLAVGYTGTSVYSVSRGEQMNSCSSGEATVKVGDFEVE
ncbi:DUF4232 domain-containing protein [Actinotignum schaalii]|uniref:DUF4232 domain-containing protein n=1 Tax=Actinotignum TaxID=1653174 RepID=UPI0004295209|nr:DUF4232 domain-containing protein [Actinotignum schaalii]AIE83021.1 hypothetical protein FB03_06900 [Actinotignum schaalii]WQN45174.1 DUF4232 domain-containing protein [Actinotignum schaalii]